jgi:hypothetical protein
MLEKELRDDAFRADDGSCLGAMSVKTIIRNNKGTYGEEDVPLEDNRADKLTEKDAGDPDPWSNDRSLATILNVSMPSTVSYM